MNWINKFQLFLFDFDGLLVDTEHLHYKAYLNMCEDRGYHLDWDFSQFLQAAHFSSTGLRKGIYERFPKLQQEEPKWEVLYEEKKKAYQKLLEEGEFSLLPGVENILIALHKAGIKRAVVTNSMKVQIEAVKRALPILDTIPLWITREDYKDPKPSPECYQKALSLLAEKGDRVIGFEDSLRGLQSLLAAGAEGVLICPPDHPQLVLEHAPKVPQFSSFLEIKEL